ncbi:hypothetical protein AC578_10107 [Pseudocercospora eumusae]|uniref:Uncharacterized protein n=1 Tax=Pseudocercospora eumusae TaxID=321146 RepID=A0A139GZK8_9PEZI|nr:hypothetical protein AC578_10107 [Pseudocercospora eumusae]
MAVCEAYDAFEFSGWSFTNAFTDADITFKFAPVFDLPYNAKRISIIGGVVQALPHSIHAGIIRQARCRSELRQQQDSSHIGLCRADVQSCKHVSHEAEPYHLLSCYFHGVKILLALPQLAVSQQ